LANLKKGTSFSEGIKSFSPDENPPFTINLPEVLVKANDPTKALPFAIKGPATRPWKIKYYSPDAGWKSTTSS